MSTVSFGVATLNPELLAAKYLHAQKTEYKREKKLSKIKTFQQILDNTKFMWVFWFLVTVMSNQFIWQYTEVGCFAMKTKQHISSTAVKFKYIHM